MRAVTPHEEVASINHSAHDGQMHSSLLLTLKLLHDKTKSVAPITPTMLHTSVASKNKQFKNKNQHDSHELFLALTSGILEEFERAKPAALDEGRPIESICRRFKGQLGNLIICHNCTARFVRFDDIVDLSLTIPGF